MFFCKNLAKLTFCGELAVVILGDKFSEGLELSMAFEGSTFVDHIKPLIRTVRVTINPLKIIGSLLSNLAPIIDTIKIEKDKIAESIQKRQYAWILKNIIYINKKLNVEEAQDIKNINHQKNLFNLSLGEIKLSERTIAIINIDK